MKIVFTGGGTAGHILPILAIVREIKANYTDLKFIPYYIGPKPDEYILNLLKEEGIKIKIIITGKLRRYFSFKIFLDFLKIPIGLTQAFFLLFFLGPDLIFSKAGYGSFSVAFWANLFNIPFFLHESDAVLGLAAEIESKWAQEIFFSFPLNDFNTSNKDQKTFLQKGIVIGNPIRKEILGGSREEAQKIFNLQNKKPVILILGGSQGAQKINEVILDVLPAFLRSFELIHQTGSRNFSEIKKEVDAILVDEDLKKNYHFYPFLDEYSLKQALAVADFVVSRAGAGAIFEIAAAGKPAFLIPLSHSSRNHQLKNAYFFVRSGGGEIIEEINLTSHFLLTKLEHIFSRPDLLVEMIENSKNFSRPNAAKVVAVYLVEYFKQISGKGT